MTRKAPTCPGYGVKIRKDAFGFVCTGRQIPAWNGGGRTREEAMVNYARRKVMTEDEFYDSGCLIVR